MHLTPKEIDKLMLLSLGAIAARRKEKGVDYCCPEIPSKESTNPAQIVRLL